MLSITGLKVSITGTDESYHPMKRVRDPESSATGPHKKRSTQSPLIRLNTDLQSMVLRHCDASSFGLLEQALIAHTPKAHTGVIVALRCAPPSRRPQEPFQPCSE